MKLPHIVFDKPPKLKKYRTKMSGVDRVLGGGLAENQTVLLGGVVGAGTTTLLAQIAAGIAAEKRQVLFALSEPLLQFRRLQIRVGALSPYVAAIDSYDGVKALIEEMRDEAFKVLIVDNDSYGESHEKAQELVAFARRVNRALIISAHHTKKGDIAGPVTIQHTVDTVLYLDGAEDEEFTLGRYRILSSSKNRYSASGQEARFKMTSSGLERRA